MIYLSCYDFDFEFCAPNLAWNIFSRYYLIDISGMELVLADFVIWWVPNRKKCEINKVKFVCNLKRRKNIGKKVS